MQDFSNPFDDPKEYNSRGASAQNVIAGIVVMMSFCIEKKSDAPTKLPCLDPQRLHIMGVNIELVRDLRFSQVELTVIHLFHSKPTLLRFICKKGPGAPAYRQTLRNRKVPVMTLCHCRTVPSPSSPSCYSRAANNAEPIAHSIAAMSFQVEIQSEFPARLHPSKKHPSY